MYLWVGISVKEDFKDMRTRCEKIAAKLEMEDYCFQLEQHISLKMSFEAGTDFDSIVNDLDELLAREKPFELEVSGIECFNGISWIKFKNNTQIDVLHRKICDLMKDKYHKELHEYDLDFLFHSTLFMDNNQNKIEEAYRLIKDIEIPNRIMVKDFLIGYSETGTLGTYRVLKRI